MQQASAAPLSGPDGSTAFVDMRQFMAHGVELPEVGRAEDSASNWHAQTAAVTEPAVPAPLRAAKAQWAQRAVGFDAEDVDLNFVLGRKSGRSLLLFASCLVAVVLACVSWYTRAAPKVEAVAAPARAPLPSAARESVAPTQPADPLGRAQPEPQRAQGEPERAQGEPERAQRAQLEPEHAQLEPEAQAEPERRQPERVGAPANEPEQRASTSAVRRAAESEAPRVARAADLAAAAVQEPSADVRRGEHVSASPERAAVLYIGGKYKEALAEYRLLAVAYPKQRVYAELARILKRKIIDTCVRTQPNRREQCREL